MARLTEADVLANHPHAIAGTLRYETDGKYHNKQTVEIRTRGLDGQFDGGVRRIATSDLHQVFWSEEVKAEVIKEKRRMKAKANRQLLKSLKIEAPAEKADADKILAESIQ